MRTDAQKFLLSHLEKVTGERTPPYSDSHLQEVMNYIEVTFNQLGYPVEHDPFIFAGITFHNLLACKDGLKSDEKIIVGAHFDSVPGSPGADDNASGVAVMLELARLLKDHKWNHPIEFIGFHMEEWNMIGSTAYAEKLKIQKAKVRGMISLEMVGYTSDQPKSQKMPLGFRLFYPEVGNFIALVGNTRSVKLLQLFKREMKRTENLPVESLIMPFNGKLLMPTRLSDHSPFWDRGWPALLITDTSFYRNPHYHSPTDTVETLNLSFMEKVTESVKRALLVLDE